VDPPSTDVHVPGRQGHLARPLADALDARELDLLRVRDVRHDDVRGAQHLVHGSRRLLRGSRGNSEGERGNQRQGERPVFHRRKKSGSSNVERKKNTTRLIKAGTGGSPRTFTASKPYTNSVKKR